MEELSVYRCRIGKYANIARRESKRKKNHSNYLQRIFPIKSVKTFAKFTYPKHCMTIVFEFLLFLVIVNEAKRSPLSALRFDNRSDIQVTTNTDFCTYCIWTTTLLAYLFSQVVITNRCPHRTNLFGMLEKASILRQHGLILKTLLMTYIYRSIDTSNTMAKRQITDTRSKSVVSSSMVSGVRNLLIYLNITNNEGKQHIRCYFVIQEPTGLRQHIIFSANTPGYAEMQISVLRSIVIRVLFCRFFSHGITCYYLIGNKGAHSYNGNPRGKQGEAHLDEGCLALIREQADKSVGWIVVDDETTGTGFRVGQTYFMTAYHVLRNKIKPVIDRICYGLMNEEDKDAIVEELSERLDVYFDEDLTMDHQQKVCKLVDTFLQRTGTDIKLLFRKLDGLIQSTSVLDQLKENWKNNCIVQFQGNMEFSIDCNIVFGDENIDVLIVRLNENNMVQPFPEAMILDEDYREQKTVQIIRYIGDEREVTIDQKCTIIQGNDELAGEVRSAIDWWEQKYPDGFNGQKDYFRKQYERDCDMAYNVDTGRVIMRASDSFIQGSSGSPIVYLFNKKGLPIVSMIYQGGLPNFYYEQVTTDLQPETRCFFERGTTMKKVSEALERCGKSVIKDEIFSKPSTPLEELFDKRNEKRPMDIMLKTVEAWSEMDKTCYITNGVLATMDEIKRTHCVCVAGVPGSGKSTAIRHAALQLQKNGYVVYNIKSPKHFMKFYSKHMSQVFVIEDIFGIYSVSKDEVGQWNSIREDINNGLGKNTKLLISVRVQIINDPFVKTKKLEFLNNLISLSDKRYKLGIQDMKGMLRLHLKNSDRGNTEDVIAKIWPPCLPHRKTGLAFADCFPLLCKAFCNDVRLDPSVYFENPFHALKDVFRNIKEVYIHQFCGLALCTFLDDFVIPTHECDDKLSQQDEELQKVIISKCKLKYPDDFEDIRCALECITGVYVIRIGNKYVISHKVFHDIVVFLYNDPLFIFKYGSLAFIMDRVRIDEPLPGDDQYVVVLDGHKYLDKLVDRLVADYRSKRNRAEWFITNNHYVDNEKFLISVKRKLFGHDDTRGLIRRVSGIVNDRTEYNTKSLVDDFFVRCMRSVWSNRGSHVFRDGDIIVKQYKFIEFLLQLGADCNVYIEFVDRYPIHIAAALGSIQLTELLLRHGADKRRVVGIPAQTVLHSSCNRTQHNLLSIVKLITQQGDQSVVKFLYSGRKNDIISLIRWCDRFCCKLGEVLSHNTFKEFNEHRNLKFSKIKEAVIKVMEYESGNDEMNEEKIIRVSWKMEQMMSDNLVLEEIRPDGTTNSLVSGDRHKIKRFVKSYAGRNQLQVLHHMHDNCLNYIGEDGKNLLHYLISIGSLECVCYICSLPQFTCLNLRDKKRKTILHYAVETANIEILCYLCCLPNLKYLNQPDVNGKHILHYAVEKGNNDVIRYLCSLSQCVCINDSDNEKKTVLHYAVDKKNKDITEYICSLPTCTCLNDVDDEDRSILHYAVRQGAIQIIRFLCNLPKFILVNHVDDEGRTALHYAVEDDNIDVIRYLCESTVFTALNVSDRNGKTILHYAVEQCGIETIKYLFSLEALTCKDSSDGWGRAVLHYAVAKRGLEVIRFLVQLAVNVQSDKKGRTVLHYAVNRGNMSVVKYWCSQTQFAETMIECDALGRNALHLAVNNIAVSRYLFTTNLVNYINQQDREGRTPYNYIVNDIVPLFSLLNSVKHGLHNRGNMLELYQQHGATL